MDKEHDCLSEVVWNDDEKTFDDDNIVIEGKCNICGKEYQEVWMAQGIWDKETKKYVATY